MIRTCRWLRQRRANSFEHHPAYFNFVRISKRLIWIALVSFPLSRATFCRTKMIAGCERCGEISSTFSFMSMSTVLVSADTQRTLWSWEQTSGYGGPCITCSRCPFRYLRGLVLLVVTWQIVVHPAEGETSSRRRFLGRRDYHKLPRSYGNRDGHLPCMNDMIVANV